MPGDELIIHIDRENRRVWIPLPIPLSAFAEDGPILRETRAVCGPNALAYTDIGTHLGAIASCPPDEVAAWRAELGLPHPPVEREG